MTTSLSGIHSPLDTLCLSHLETETPTQQKNYCSLDVFESGIGARCFAAYQLPQGVVRHDNNCFGQIKTQTPQHLRHGKNRYCIFVVIS